MFKDTYKAANEDITPDSALIEKTLTRIKKGRAHPPLTFKMAFACAMSLLVAAGSIFGYMHYMDYSNLKPSPKIVRVDTNIESENISDTQKSDLPDTYSKALQTDKNSTADLAKASENQSNMQTVSEEDAMQKKSDFADIDSTAAQAQNTEDSASHIFSSDEADKASISSGGGGSNAHRERSQTISYSSYCQYIGTDIFKKLHMPEDVTANIWEKAEFNESIDEITFSFIGKEKSAYVTPTKNTEKIYALIQSHLPNEKAKNHISVYEKDYSYAYIVSGGVGYSINCYGFSEGEFTQLTDSILN